jgi:hypothetical protein
VKGRLNKLQRGDSVWFGGKIRERRAEGRKRTTPSISSHKQVIADPNHQCHRHTHCRNPQSMRPSAFVSSHVPTQQCHEETRRQSHRPLADQERRVDALELLIQEMKERIVKTVIWGCYNESEERRGEGGERPTSINQERRCCPSTKSLDAGKHKSTN